ncbi:MAG: chromosome partitioning protein ParB [bacterium]|nr:chromosome partitioning protein ParB [bacterium]
MTEDIELASLDLRYEGHRMKDPEQERKLLARILERGIERPLEGVTVDGERVLLHGFKRYRCAKKLGLGTVPYASLGSDEAAGIIGVLCASSEKGLNILEQAQFIDELHQTHGMSPADIAETLSRSKSWVMMRLDLVSETSGVVREKILGGAFGVYSYMYTLRPFMRMADVSKKDIEGFVSAVSGKKLSVREIDKLAHGYFRGPEWFRKEIDNDNLTLVTARMKEVPDPPDRCDGFEGVMLRDLDSLSKSMQRMVIKTQDRRLAVPTGVFCSQANILLSGLLGRMSGFQQALRGLHDRTGNT